MEGHDPKKKRLGKTDVWYHMPIFTFIFTNVQTNLDYTVGTNHVFMTEQNLTVKDQILSGPTMENIGDELLQNPGQTSTERLE